MRGIWYWKDLLNEVGINSSSLETWQGYIEATKKLNSESRNKGIQGTVLFNVTYSPDLWYPYLWMLGGNIIQLKDGHPTKEAYWFPAYNNTEGVRAIEFIKQQVDSGIKPEDGDLEKEFALKRFAVYIGGQWTAGRFLATGQNVSNFEQQVGFIPMFPVPNKEDTQTSTMMGLAFDYSCCFEKQGLGMGADYNNARAKNTCTLVSQV